MEKRRVGAGEVQMVGGKGLEKRMNLGAPERGEKKSRNKESADDWGKRIKRRMNLEIQESEEKEVFWCREI